MIYYQLQGQLRDDIKFAAEFPVPSIFDETIKMQVESFTRADFVVFQNRGTAFGEEGLESVYALWLGMQEPDFTMWHGNVPLIMVYQR